ncbi:MAG: hypothetical protein Kow0042_27010 [Calditrichia bacterium]
MGVEGLPIIEVMGAFQVKDWEYIDDKNEHRKIDMMIINDFFILISLKSI